MESERKSPEPEREASSQTRLLSSSEITLRSFFREHAASLPILLLLTTSLPTLTVTYWPGHAAPMLGWIMAIVALGGLASVWRPIACRAMDIGALIEVWQDRLIVRKASRVVTIRFSDVLELSVPAPNRLSIITKYGKYQLPTGTIWEAELVKRRTFLPRCKRMLVRLRRGEIVMCGQCSVAQSGLMLAGRHFIWEKLDMALREEALLVAAPSWRATAKGSDAPNCDIVLALWHHHLKGRVLT